MLGSEQKATHVPGQAPVKKIILSWCGVDEYRQRGKEALHGRLNAMEEENRADLDHLQSLAEDEDFHAGDQLNFPEMVDMRDILTGAERGGEFVSLEEDIEEEWADEHNENQQIAHPRFSEPDARDGIGLYLYLCSEDVTTEEIYEIQVVDMFETSSVEVRPDPWGNGVVPALILVQMIPCAPDHPTVAVKVWVQEAYRVTHVRCPHPAIQVFVKSLCGLHGIPCTYKLEGEDALIFDMLTMMDVNDSLKQVLRHEKMTMADSEMDEPVLGKSSEHVDNRDVGVGYYISWEHVERWAKDRVADRLPIEKGNAVRAPRAVGIQAHTFQEEENPCADRWKNMINDVTSKMWGIFDETGIFLALCRHGFVLVIADLIRSGEL
ncbi:hypothetical protein K438DRAFT_1753871 [Mycena galopus ATCC 62051]|nr:hypothetical protein K438DRAFT_1753871 [Mycena galopus ATCC 62051]